MPIACQLIKPLCFVTGMEKHTGIGLTPPVPVPVPCPNPLTAWASAGTTCLTPAGDWKSADVFGDDCALVKRGSDTKYLRPHLSLFSSPLPSVVPPGSDLGLIALHIAMGSSKTLFGPFSVTANITAKTDNPAVILLAPTMFVGPFNHTLCCDPVRVPALLGIQAPNSVFAGMTWGDVFGCLVLYAISAAIGAATGGLLSKGPVGRFMGRFSNAVSSRLAPALARVAPERLLRLLFIRAVDEERKIVVQPLTDIVTSFTQGSIEDMLENGLGIPFINNVGGGGPRLTGGWSSVSSWVANKIAL